VIDPVRDPLVGTTVLGSYLLESALGVGGMASVYRGRHRITDQAVAVKVLPPELTEQDDVKDRFIAEAKILARLEHRNITLLHNFGEESEHLFLVMQLAEGPTLEDVIRQRGRLSVEAASEIGVQVLDALEYAHSQGVIHRDIKPSNIMVAADGCVKVMDFGVAKIVGSSRMTRTGMTMGTAHYMSPEQVRGHTLDGRSDLYSLSVVLYEAITGELPFTSANQYQAMRHHVATLPKAPSDILELPADLEAVLLKGLKKRPDQRFQVAADYRSSLRKQFQEVVAVPSQAPPDTLKIRGRRKKHWTVYASVLIALLSVGAMSWALLTEKAKGIAEVGTRFETFWRQQAWTTDRLIPKESLHLRSTAALKEKTFVERYREVRQAWLDTLPAAKRAKERRPLRIAVVEEAALAESRWWAQPDPEVVYLVRYHPTTGLLLVRSGPGWKGADLAFGLGLHFATEAGLGGRQRLALAQELSSR
jgi:serine/threonine protein kinase